MAITSGFFNSVNGDRRYNAEQINDYLTGLVSGGVYESVGGGLQVKVNSGMKVQVASGKLADSNGRWLQNDSTLVLTLDAADLVLNRYDAIVAKMDSNQSQRTGTITIKKGTAASTPTKPTAERTQFVEEYILAYVYIGKGVTAITQAQIEDTRVNTSICGFVTGLIKQVDTSQLFLQYQTAYAQFLNELNDWKRQQKTAFDSWFATLTDELKIDTYIGWSTKTWNRSEPLETDDITDIYNEGDLVFVFINGLLVSQWIDYTIIANGPESNTTYVLKLKNKILNTSINPVTFFAIRSKIGSQPT
ncbi:hypothetical protein [Robinsoniella sp. KNHs210]|uniref:hypothetical protein n=3 Tax=Robinsoniella sp. KNHs210 TaxID=1469950 RepID=UPI000484C2DC|nr:hypothetical protein [Robinsoniella sp. KNHs210]